MEIVDYSACPKCGKVFLNILNSRDYCEECGSLLIHRCPRCGKSIDGIDQSRCVICGFDYFSHHL